MIVDKDGCSDDPLPIEFAPRDLSPACVCYGEVQTIFVQLLPILGGNDMSEGIGIVMRHHLGIARGA